LKRLEGARRASNAWDTPKFVEAIEEAKRKTLVIAATRAKSASSISSKPARSMSPAFRPSSRGTDWFDRWRHFERQFLTP
jgi:hypothetical protein